MATWRHMRVSDLPAAEALGGRFHVHHPEGADIAPERLRLAPEWCFVLGSEAETFGGYCVAHPWAGPLPPGLNVHLGELPSAPDTVHLHDVVLDEAHRGQGHAERLMTLLVGQACRHKLAQITLIAVGGADRYWTRLGFAPDPDPARVAFVGRSYGSDGLPMLRLMPIAAA